MGPDNPVIVIGLWIVAAAVFASAVAVGARLGGRGLRVAAGRSGVTMAACLAVLLAVTGTMNAQFGWYTNWPALWHTVTGGAVVQNPPAHAGGRPKAGAPVSHRSATASAAAEYAPERAAFARAEQLHRVHGTAGQYLSVRVPGVGPAAGPGAGRVLIWLPSSYTDPSHARRTYPVIEAFHGIPGGPQSYRHQFSAARLLGQAAARGRLAQAILVAPELTPSGVDTECVNGGGITMETWLTHTLPQWVMAHLRVKASPGGWATFGYSMGGWCAAMATVLHPSRFSAAILLGAYFHPMFGADWDPFRGGAVPARYRLLDWMRTHHPRVDLWVDVSQQDRLSGPGSARLVRLVRAPTSVTSVTLPYAGHQSRVWLALAPEALAWLGRTVPAFSPTRSRGGPSAR